MAQTNITKEGIQRAQFLPTGTVDKLSSTSNAYTCFTKQVFSNKTQAFMINYVMSISSLYSNYLGG